MLQITVPVAERWDDVKEEFVGISKEQTLQLEHSLVSLSKWESKWCKPFLLHKEKSIDEIIDYIRCMTLTQNVDPEVYDSLTSNNIDEINSYINAPMTATTFSDDQGGKNSREVITAELIYYWMIVQRIPFECQYWHINRLLTLIKVCSIKSSPPKKMSMRERMSRNTALNAARRKRLGTKG